MSARRQEEASLNANSQLVTYLARTLFPLPYPEMEILAHGARRYIAVWEDLNREARLRRIQNGTARRISEELSES